MFESSALGLKAVCIVALCVGIAASPSRAEDDSASSTPPREDEGTLQGRQHWWKSRHLNVAGVVPFGAFSRSLAQLDANVRAGKLRVASASNGGDAIEGDQWFPIGPLQNLDGTYANSGRVTALAVHPTDPNTVYLGAAQGGVWKTTDGGSNWVALTDGQDSLAIGALAIDPSHPNTIYAGTGEANQACDSYFGIGILKSTDAGATWSRIGGSEFLNASIARIVVDPSDAAIVWAGTTAGVAGFDCVSRDAEVGLWKSLDSGNTWSRVLGPAQLGTNRSVFDVVLAPGNSQTVYAGVRRLGVFKSVDGGANWVQLQVGLPTSDIGRVDLAIDPQDANAVFVVMERDSTGAQLGTWRTLNAGATWTALPIPTGNCSYWSFSDVCTYSGTSISQCVYDLAIEVQANGTVWLGGMAIFKSTNRGSNWQSVCPQSVHVDQHAFAFGSDGRVWVGNDGGVWASSSAGSTWQNRNTNLAITQFYPGAAVDPSNYDRAIGGTQDNGTPRYTGTSSWREQTGGDGAACAIDSVSPATTWYTSSQFLDIYKTTNGGGTYGDADAGLLDSGTSTAPFISPVVICPANPQVLIAGSDNVWRTNNASASWISNSPDPLSTAGLTALSFARTSDCSIYAAASYDGRVFITASGGVSWREITGPFGGRSVNDLGFSPVDPNVLYIAIGGFGGPHIFRTEDALATTPNWAAADPGLPDSPANAILVDPETPTVVYAGTDVGLFKSQVGGASWVFQANGIPKLAIYDVVADLRTRAVIAFTHGRGAFRLNLVCTAPAFAGVGDAADVDRCAQGVSVSWSVPASWGQRATNGTYEVQRFDGTSCIGTPIALASGLPANEITYLDSTAIPGQTYSYRVIATNNCSTPASSAGVNACSAPVTEIAEPDLDADAVCGGPGGDNCPSTFNPSQHDFDHDGFGDACAASPELRVGPASRADADYHTIQAAVNAAQTPGTTIAVLTSAPQYAEAVTVPSEKGLVITGENGDVSVDATGLGGPVFTVVANPNARTTHFSNLTINGDVGGIKADAPTVINSCSFHRSGSGYAAVSLEAQSGPSLVASSSFQGPGVTYGVLSLGWGNRIRGTQFQSVAINAIQVNAGSLDVENSLIFGGTRGVALSSNIQFTLRHSTISGCSSFGITAGLPSNTTVRDSIVWGSFLDLEGVDCAFVSSSDIGNTPCAGNGNISADPIFDATYRLALGSPAIDAGQPVGSVVAPCQDLAGRPRFADGNADGLARLDMGAYEFQPAIPPTPAVRNLRWPVTPFHTRAEWDAVPGATSYHVYRDLVSALVGGVRATCRDDLDMDRTDTVLIDDDEPATAKSYYYLITASDAGGESSLGDDTCVARANTATCP